MYHTSVKTVLKWKNRNDFKNKSYVHKKEYDVNSVKELIKKFPNYSSRKLSNEFKKENPNNEGPSYKTIQNYEKWLGVKSLKNKKVHQLSLKEKELRVEICKELKGKTKIKKIIYLDETSTSNQYISSYINVIPGEGVKYLELINAKGLQGHFFGGISYNYKSKLVWYNKKLNSEEYQKMLEQYIITQMDQKYGWKINEKRNWKILHDNDPTHVSNSTKDFLETFEVITVRHPPWSPDMNPIEYIWSIFWHRISLKSPKTNLELKEIAFKVWDEISIETIKNVIDKLDDIYSYIIDNNGEYYKKNFNK